MTAENQPQDIFDPIKVTDSAIMKVYELMEGENNLDLKLRVYITGGGCSGFQYGFAFEEEIKTDDFEIPKSIKTTNTETKKIPSITVLVDAMSLQYLTGAEIDYRKDINGEQFIIKNNPHAKTTCGCGSSFSAETKE